MLKEINIPENPVSRFLFSSTKAGWIWLFVRLYLGYSWITAGWKKVNSDAWVGENGGAAIKGFVSGLYWHGRMPAGTAWIDSRCPCWGRLGPRRARSMEAKRIGIFPDSSS